MHAPFLRLIRRRSETVDQLLRLLSYLPRRRFRALLLLIPLSLIPGITDLISIGVVARLAGALIGTPLDDKVPWMKVFGGNTANQTVWLIAIFIGVSWFSSFSKLTLQVVQQRLTAQVWRDFSDAIHKRVLNQQYSYHLVRSTAKLSSLIMKNIKVASGAVISPLMRIVGSILSVILISAGILIAGKGLALALIITLTTCYLVFSLVITPYLRHASNQSVRLDIKSNHLLLESLASIKDIQLTNSEGHFEKAFVSAGQEAQRYQWMSAILPILPRLLIEPLGITLIFVLGALPAILHNDPGQIKALIPSLAALVLAAQRLTPPLQDFFGCITQLRGGLPKIKKTVELLELPYSRPTLQTPGVPLPESVFPRFSIRLRNVHYTYPKTSQEVLHDINLSIPVGSRVALVGTTGSGKSTTANILLGLLVPQQGALELDGQPVDELDVPAWQANCALVPQHIALLDASFRENVAFGLEEEEIDNDRLWEAIEASQLAEFVAELPYGLMTPVGENGMKLSGGQRQRLALARAFYRNARFLVLDEATSALDNRTESDVISALQVIGRRCTTVVIAHRISTVARCDRIYEFSKGRIVDYGSFEELKNSSGSFRELARLESMLDA
ncbi:MAG: ABC transporter ATP-binding protein [Cyanobacteriota bacterium]